MRVWRSGRTKRREQEAIYNKVIEVQMKRNLFWIPAVILMIGIFYFSNQPAEVSGELSGGIAYNLVDLIADAFGADWNQEEIIAISQQVDYPIRKLAHLTEYALLGMAVALGVVYGSDIFILSHIQSQYVQVQLIGSLYAASDEIHQLFVPGRAGMLGDVLIDSVGVLIGWGVFIGMRKIWRWK